MATLISIYPTLKDTRNGKEIPVDIFLEEIKSGKWQDLIIPLRAKEDKAQRKVLKEKLPYVTISGTFSQRKDDGLISHSGLLAIDVDDCDPRDIKAQVRKDRHVYAAFASCSGRGCCIIFKIHPLKHLASFEGIAEYLFQHYKIVVDQNCKDISRPRYVSYDPDIIINDHAQEFKQYAKGKPGKKVPAKEKNVVFIHEDFVNIITDIDTRSIDICPTYNEWLRVGFAIADKYGEAGRAYFHTISQQGSTYTEKSCDRQYDACVEAKNTGVTISTFYYICRQYNVNTASERVNNISKAAATHKKAHTTLQQAIKNIVDFTDKDLELVTNIATQIFEKNIEIDDVSNIESGRIWIRNKNIKRNEISGLLHQDNGKALTNTEVESLELLMREELPDLDRSDISLMLRSSVVPTFNELFAFFNKYQSINPRGSISRLAATIKSPTGEGTDYVERMLTKWLVGGIACLYSDEAHTMLVLCGEHHGTGKSFFFKNLLPMEISHLTFSKDFSMLSSDTFKRDMDIAITKAWLIYDDEMGGKSKRDHRAIKAMLAKSFTDVRAAYAKTEEHRKRIAFFGGTSNDLDVIPEHGEQRRIIAIEVTAIDQEAKDMIDPVDYIMEAYHLYHSGYNYKILGKDIDFLNEHTEKFKEISMESELLQAHFRKPTDKSGSYMTGTQIKSVLDIHTKERLNPGRLNAALKDMGVKQEFRRVNGQVGRYYFIGQYGLDIYKSPLPTNTRPLTDEDKDSLTLF